MIIKIIGSRDINFKNDDGQEVKGKQYAYLFEDPHINGYWYDKFFISEGRSLPCEIMVGHDYDISSYFRSTRLDFQSLKLIK